MQFAHKFVQTHAKTEMNEEIIESFLINEGGFKPEAIQMVHETSDEGWESLFEFLEKAGKNMRRKYRVWHGNYVVSNNEYYSFYELLTE